jgi:Tol biopolymer transport system component
MNARRINTGAVGLLALTILSLIGCSSGSAASGVYVFNTEKDSPTWLGQVPGLPVWSPKKDLVSWGTEDGLVIGSAGDAVTRILVAVPVAGAPAWSPDGTKIAFVDESEAALVVTNAMTGQTVFRTPVATDSDAVSTVDSMTMGGPDWSPDGTRIAFVCWDGAGDEVCVIGADGKGRRQVTRLEPLTTSGPNPALGATATSNVGPPAWSPNGQLLAVAAYPERSGAPVGVFVIDMKGDSARQITKLQPNSSIQWLPDGQSVEFSATDKGRSDAVRVSVGDRTTKKLTQNLPAGARNPAISIDGKRLAVASGGSIVILDGDAPPVYLPSSGLQYGNPAWNWSGNLLAFTATEDPLSKYS